MSVRVGIRLPPCKPPNEVALAAVEAERLGFAEVWFPDSQLLWRDVFVTLTAAAAATEVVQLGTAVTNLQTRHPAVLASAARSVAEVADGRFVLGLGVGNSSVAPVGLRPSTQAQMREGITMLRQLFAGNQVDFGGVRSVMRDPGRPPQLLMAASGPGNLRLAGELADGAILLSGISPGAVASSRDKVATGASEAGKTIDQLQLVVSTYAHVTDDVEKDARQLKPICAGIAQMGGLGALASVGIDVDVPARVSGVYPDLVHAEDWDAAVDICGQWITDEDAYKFAQEFCLFGTPSEILARVHEVEAAGATSLFLQHVGSYSLPHSLMESFGDVLTLMGQHRRGRRSRAR